MKLKIIDNFLKDSQRIELYNKYSNNKQSFEYMWFEKKDFPEIFNEMIDEIAKDYDLENVVGYEVWTHYNSITDWHFDKDEKLYKTTNIIKLPLCSIIYYPFIDNLVGGKLLMPDINITPVTNRLVIFSSKIVHKIDNYTGERFSLMINPWTEKPMGY
jgi:hypothetical protein